MSYKILTWFGTTIFLFNISCKKLVEVAPPINYIESSTAFFDDASATSSVNGIYSQMVNGASINPVFGTSALTLLGGLSADELSSGNAAVIPFEQNALDKNDGLVFSIWQRAYTFLYHANACIEGLEKSVTLSGGIKKQLLGESRCLRAFILFYLVNLYGDAPLPLTTNWKVTSTLGRVSKVKLYEQIIGDLIESKNLLSDNYPTSEKIRINKWAATALLARTYLYLGEWSKAEAQASEVIGSGMYSLETDLNNVYLGSSLEAIWQLKPLDKNPYTAYEGSIMIPSGTSIPRYFFTADFLSAFEPGDSRKDAWMKKQTRSGQTYMYPFKYKIKTGEPGIITEYNMLLRFAELYLIRAEARANQNIDLPGAINDINTIRFRAVLPELPLTLTQEQTLMAIEQERRIEFMAEWGHRWLDLKRTGKADIVLAPLKSGWQPSDQLYPIPQAEINNNPNLIQNPGYN